MEDAGIKALLGILRVGPAALDSRWTDVEASLHLKLPYSYKRMVDLFGASRWANFLQVLSPFEPRLNLHEIGERILQTDRTTRQSFPHLSASLLVHHIAIGSYRSRILRKLR